MKIICILWLTLGMAAISYSQDPSIKDLESNLATKDGSDYVSDALSLSKLYYEAGKFELSAVRADEVLQEAKKENLGAQAAIALNHRGMAIMKLADGKRAPLNRAFRSFEESNRFTTDQSLKLENFQNMKVIAAILGKDKEIKNIDYNLALLKGEDPGAPLLILVLAFLTIEKRQFKSFKKLAQRSRR